MTYLKTNHPSLSEAFQHLTVGSFEQLLSRVEAAVRAQAVTLFGESVEATVVSTFPNYGIAVANGKTVRFRFEDKDSKIHILAHEAIDTPKNTSECRASFARAESRKVADLFVSGDLTEAKSKLRHLSQLVDERFPTQDAQIVESMIGFRRADRPWKQVFRTKSDEIKRLVLDEASKIENDLSGAKFRSLYNGSIERDRIDTYRDLVTESIDKAIKHTDSLHKGVSAALTSVAGSSDSVVSSFTAFAKDLAEDLRAVSKTLQEAKARVFQTEYRAKLFDSLMEDFRDRELASLFISKMSRRLQDAS